MLPPELNQDVEEFITKLKRRQVVGSHDVALETAKILRLVISSSRWRDVDKLLITISELGGRLASAQPKELAVGNIVRRVLKLIREVARGEMDETGSVDVEHNKSGFHSDSTSEDGLRSRDSDIRPFSPHSSMFQLLADIPTPRTLEPDSSYNLKPLIIQAIREEIINDIKTVYKSISEKAHEYIRSNEVIMTIGMSRTVQEFLLRASKKHTFQVIVAETSPSYQGHVMAAKLAEGGIDTTVIADSAIFAVMPQVNKVILGAHAVLANGGLIAVTGSHLLAAAAKHHATPVLVCTALYKLSPLYAYDTDAFNITMAPNGVLDFQEGPILDKVKVFFPYYDYVGPSLISLFIHDGCSGVSPGQNDNHGASPPTYIYRLINDNYDPEDTIL